MIPQQERFPALVRKQPPRQGVAADKSIVMNGLKNLIVFAIGFMLQ